MECDLIAADKTATFALTEVRVGTMAGAGGLVRLPRHIPPMVATEMVLTGRRVGAAEAKQLGLVNRIAAPGAALEAARALAAEILQGAPLAVRWSLQVMHECAQYASEQEALLHRSPARE